MLQPGQGVMSVFCRKTSKSLKIKKIENGNLIQLCYIFQVGN